MGYFDSEEELEEELEDEEPEEEEWEEEEWEEEPEEDEPPIYVATRTCNYRFICDGTSRHLTRDVSPLDLTEAQLEELIRYERVREVK